jgi:hypothetical protein
MEDAALELMGLLGPRVEVFWDSALSFKTGGWVRFRSILYGWDYRCDLAIFQQCALQS